MFVRSAVSKSSFRCAVMKVELSDGIRVEAAALSWFFCLAAVRLLSREQRSEQLVDGFRGECRWLCPCTWWCRWPLWVVSYTCCSPEQTLPSILSATAQPPYHSKAGHDGARHCTAVECLCVLPSSGSDQIEALMLYVGAQANGVGQMYS